MTNNRLAAQHHGACGRLFFCWGSSPERQEYAETGVRCRTDNERDADQAATGPPTTEKSNYEKVHSMLYTIAVVLLVLWLLGLVTSYTLGGFIHILLVIALIMIVVNLLSGRRAL
jgi:hypothetical protein